MKKTSLGFVSLVSFTFAVCAVVACSSDGNSRDSANGGDGGSSDGGKGGANDGGKGGANTGGKGGAATGGKGGANTGGSSGGVVGTGGAMMGTGGAVMGTGGMMGAGGVMGMAGMPGSMTPAAESGVFLFTGKAATMEKLVSSDPAAGYFYSGGDASATGGAEMLTGTQTMGLPDGITFALSAKPLRAGLTILGANFRANDGEKWRFFDASAYAGITFWARATKPMVLNTTVVDAENTTPGDKGGTCPAATPAAEGACKPVAGRDIILTATWKQFKVGWTDFINGGPAAPASLARIDWLTFQQGDNVDFWITSVRLATLADLE